MSTKLYKSTNGESFVQLLTSVFYGLKAGHSLGVRLFIRDLKSGFEASLLGYLWLVIPALASAGLWIFINHQNVIEVSETRLPYAAFVMIGTTIWTVFSEALNKPTLKFKAAMPLMVKLNFPREAIIVSSLYDLLFSSVLKLLVLFGILVFTGIDASLSWLMVIITTLGALITGLSIGIVISPIGVLFNDMAKGLTLILPFLMYLSPVVFNINPDSLLGKIQFLNPITPWIESSRSLIGGYPVDVTSSIWIWLLLSSLLALLGLMALRIALPIIVERSGT
jgi:lipopolysaccharide transport system permease protein